MIDQVRPAELAAWFAQNPDAPPVLLDVREPWELQTASVAPQQGFTLVAIPMNEIPARVSELDPGQRIACCRLLRQALCAAEGIDRHRILEAEGLRPHKIKTRRRARNWRVE